MSIWDIVCPVFGEVRFRTQDWKVGHTRSVIVLSNRTIQEAMDPGDLDRMRARFLQIINPQLIQPGEESPPPPVSPSSPVPAFAAAAAQYSEFAS